jgi:hypothetical protein
MKAKKILFYAIACLLGGCIPVMSINPFYTSKDVTFEEIILGTWENDSNNEKGSTWIFERAEDSNTTYKLTYINRDGAKGLFKANLLKLNGKLFLDVYPKGNLWGTEDPNKVEFVYNSLLMIPAHTIIRVDSLQPNILLFLTSEDKIGEFLKEHPDAIEYKEIEGRTVLTSPTTELQAFILKFIEDESLFPNKIDLNRKK